MKKRKQQERSSAVQRYIAGEDVESICASLDRSRRWLYKWLARHTPDESTGYEELSRRPLSSPHRTSAEIEQIDELMRSLVQQGPLLRQPGHQMGDGGYERLAAAFLLALLSAFYAAVN